MLRPAAAAAGTSCAASWIACPPVTCKKESPLPGSGSTAAAHGCPLPDRAGCCGLLRLQRVPVPDTSCAGVPAAARPDRCRCRPGSGSRPVPAAARCGLCPPVRRKARPRCAWYQLPPPGFLRGASCAPACFRPAAAAARPDRCRFTWYQLQRVPVACCCAGFCG